MRDALLRWAPGAGFTEAQVDYAIAKAADWAVPGGHMRVDWVRAIQGYMRDGWALKGFMPPTHVPPARHRTAEEILEDERTAALRAAHARLFARAGLPAGWGDRFTMIEIEAEAVAHLGEAEARRLGLGEFAE
jgi:hypothetical protein